MKLLDMELRMVHMETEYGLAIKMQSRKIYGKSSYNEFMDRQETYPEPWTEWEDVPTFKENVDALFGNLESPKEKRQEEREKMARALIKEALHMDAFAEKKIMTQLWREEARRWLDEN